MRPKSGFLYAAKIHSLHLHDELNTVVLTYLSYPARKLSLQTANEKPRLIPCPAAARICSAIPVGANGILPRSSLLLPRSQVQGRFIKPNAHNVARCLQQSV